MNSRMFLLCALLSSPAWSQETPTFDLKSDTVTNILRATAATQVSTPQVDEIRPSEKKPATVRYVPPEKGVPVERPKPRIPPMPKAADTILGSLVDVVVETAIDNALGLDAAGHDDLWQGCRYVDPKATSMQYQVTPECMQSATNAP